MKLQANIYFHGEHDARPNGKTIKTTVRRQPIKMNESQQTRANAQ
jgi:hypothetical protein